MLETFAWTSTVQVSPLPLTLVSVREPPFQLTKTKTREPGAAAPVVVNVELVPVAFSPLLPRFWSNAIAEGVAPVPESATVCGLPTASSLTVTLALREPVAEGEKVTEIVQVALTASVAGATGQAFVCAKSPGFGPARPTLAIESGALPMFFNVTVCAGLVVPTVCAPKARLAGVNVTAGSVPVPVSGTICGLPLASSAIETLALRLPVAAGENVTDTEHAVFTASVLGEVGQVLVCANSPAFVPVSPMLLIESGALPVFVNVTVCAAAVVPTRCDPKLKLDGESETAGPGAVPVPVSGTACGLPDASSLIDTLALRPPSAVGVNDTETVHEPFAAKVDGETGQLFDCAKSPAFVPVRPTPLIASGAFPVFINVTDCAALVPPTGCEPKLRLEGDSDTAGEEVPPLLNAFRMLDVVFWMPAFA